MTNETTTDTLDLIAAKQAAVMKAARHLSASRMAWVANRWTSGIDWGGCNKGHIAKSLIARNYFYRGSIPISRANLETLCYRLRRQVNTRGETALVAEDTDRVNAKVTSLRTKAATLESAMALHKSGKRVNYKVENTYNDCVRTANNMESALKKALSK